MWLKSNIDEWKMLLLSIFMVRHEFCDQNIKKTKKLINTYVYSDLKENVKYYEGKKCA